MPKTVHISPSVREVLAASIISGAADRPTLKLPEGQLDRLVYEATAKVLKALGGKWNRSAAGFIFDRPFEGELAGALSSGKAVDVKRGLEQFFTPADLAARMVAALDIREGDFVLEPSAGNGRLIWEALERGAFVEAIEQDEHLVEELAAAKARYPRLKVYAADFLRFAGLPLGGFDKAIMNPPFSGNKDIAHVRRAFDFLRPGGRLVAVMSPHFTFANDAASKEFRALLGFNSPGGDDITAYSVTSIEAGAFKESGTGVSSVLVMIEKAG
jgi:predicted RNA methylase